jgi:hypothetical protein
LNCAATTWAALKSRERHTLNCGALHSGMAAHFHESFVKLTRTFTKTVRALHFYETVEANIRVDVGGVLEGEEEDAAELEAAILRKQGTERETPYVLLG